MLKSESLVVNPVMVDNFVSLFLLHAECLARLMRTEKFQPEGKRIMPETRFTEFSALSVDPRVGVSQAASETDV